MKKLAVMYLRLSRDDGEEIESNSISSQRELIKAYGKQHGLNISCEYVDDGVSGATFNRPSFKRMMEDLEKGKIETIVVKDLSRFGRDYNETGKYLQKIFPEKKVRFISINDNYDSMNADANDTHLVLPIKNFINDSYCRDISMKVKSSQQMKRKKGEFIGAFAPFGYKKNPNDKHQLIIDQEVKGIIETIFNKKVDGYSSSSIAKYLNELGIVTPARHREKKLGDSVGFVGKDKKWDAKMINRIISNPVYIGTLEQGKQMKLNYKSDKRIDIKKEDWVVIENAHKGIISQSIFAIANEMLLRDVNSRGIPGLFSGMLFCKDCGSQMIRRVVKYKDKTNVFYICGSHNDSGECSRHSVKEDELKDVVEHLLNDFLHYNERIYHHALRQDFNSIEFKAEVEDLLQEKKKYETLRQSLFMDLEDDLITEEEFNRFRASYALKIKEISVQIENKNKIMNEVQEKIRNRQWLIDLDELKEDGKLDRKRLVYLVNRIKIGEEKKISVVFNHMDELNALETLIKQAQIKEKSKEGKLIAFPLNRVSGDEVVCHG